jgi:hypothetical protein
MNIHNWEEVKQKLNGLNELEQIELVEAHLTLHKGTFCWNAHNELRHLHSRNEAKSFYHADVILANSIMDSYMLNILSGWNLENPNQQVAINTFLSTINRYPNLVHICAACLIKAGELYQKMGHPLESQQMFEKVLQLSGGEFLEALQQYKNLVTSQYR